jgi:hypothetical protein
MGCIWQLTILIESSNMFTRGGAQSGGDKIRSVSYHIRSRSYTPAISQLLLKTVTGVFIDNIYLCRLQRHIP